MPEKNEYDIAIVGGGLAGLAAAVLLRRQGHSVALFEKETYPFHKVCGEYISLESRDFLQGLGLPLADLQLPVIDTLQLTSPNGKMFTTPLPLGGFGISRYTLDASLVQLAREAGVHVFEGTKVERIQYASSFIIHAAGQVKTATVCCAAWGKRSNLDVRWNRSFLQSSARQLDNYIGIKYHIKTAGDSNVIGLHNFKDGYCGISKIEEDKYCLCYMTTSANLKNCKNSISLTEKYILFQNPHLRKIFTQSEFLEGFPVTISQISFGPKTKVENGVLMLGDAAGMITPLCGNGMSIALHTAKIAANLIDVFLKNQLTRKELERQYALQWQKEFGRRLTAGRILQSFFGGENLSNTFISLVKTFPSLAAPIIRQTHGKPF